MAEIYRVEKGSEEWKYKAYDYVRTDAFCLGQNIPIELEFGQDESKDDLQAILLTEDHKPVAGFYEKLGYKLNPDADLSVYDHHVPKKDEEPKKPKKNLGFTCVLVEKYV